MLKIKAVLSVCLMVLAVSGCENIGQLRYLSNVALDPKGDPAQPAVLAEFEGDVAVTSADEWRDRRAPVLREAFQRDLYGYFPDESEVMVGEVQLIDDDAYDGLATIELVPLTIRTRFGEGEWVERTVRLVLAKPKAATTPSPVILKMGVCPFNETFRHDGLPNGEIEIILPAKTKDVNGLTKGEIDITLPAKTKNISVSCTIKGFSPLDRLESYALGRYHVSPPIEEMIGRGYAFAAINVLDYVVDSSNAGRLQLELLSRGHDGDTAWGAIAAWASQFSRAIDYLYTDEDLDVNRTAIYGHSRYGKAALVAGAFDDRVDAVIAHQSGRGGAALTRSVVGEPVAEMTATYHDWFSKAYTNRAKDSAELPFDQHQLIALLSPRPVLLGHARRDKWSDPNGAFRAAQGADQVYELFGSEGLTAERLNEFDPDADIAFWIRPGTHGEVKEDWSAFSEFLDAHF